MSIKYFVTKEKAYSKEGDTPHLGIHFWLRNVPNEWDTPHLGIHFLVEECPQRMGDTTFEDSSFG
ncbi:MAG: hypothetical protein VR72_07985 [Clostridiaceae bacterium BRH_c20a]|nr:MAG: hypothetical protein VR72_07985 [Clostridiaceae bacterium BRH_c20a]